MYRFTKYIPDST